MATASRTPTSPLRVLCPRRSVTSGGWCGSRGPTRSSWWPDWKRKAGWDFTRHLVLSGSRLRVREMCFGMASNADGMEITYRNLYRLLITLKISVNDVRVLIFKGFSVPLRCNGPHGHVQTRTRSVNYIEKERTKSVLIALLNRKWFVCMCVCERGRRHMFPHLPCDQMVILFFLHMVDLNIHECDLTQAF